MAEPDLRRTNDAGGKYYEHPFLVGTDGAPRRYDSVTTVLGIIGKDALKYWAAKGAARRAMEHLPKLLNAAMREPCGSTWARDDHTADGASRCGDCYECHVRWIEMWHISKSEERKREGSAIHDVLEWWTLHGEWPSYDPVIEPYIVQCRRMVEEYGLKPESWLMCETSVFHHAHRYAGTLDGVVRFEPVTEKSAKLCARVLGRATALEPVDVVFDAKSREGEGKALYMEQPLQLAAYRFAEDALIKPTNQFVKMPATQGAVIFQPRPDGYTLEPVVADAHALKAFIDTLGLYRWQQEHGAASIRVNSFPMPEGFTWPLSSAGQIEENATAEAPTPVKKAVRKRATRTALPGGEAAPEQRVARAPVDRVTVTGRRGLSDDDIPF